LAVGYDAQASGKESVALGAWTRSTGKRSFTSGWGVKAATDESATVGRWNASNRSSDGSLFVVGNGSYIYDRSDALVVKQSGDVTVGGNLQESSDRRLKTDIEEIDGETIEKLQEIEPVTFEFKDQESRPKGEQVGLIAQDVRKEFPQLVEKKSNGYLSLSYTKLTAVLVEAIQKQEKKLEEKKSKIAEIERRVERLENSGGFTASAGWNGSGLMWGLIGLLGGALFGLGVAY
jgi:hypothetical protein